MCIYLNGKRKTGKEADDKGNNSKEQHPLEANTRDS
jgi:hypothetical protein